MIEPSTAEFKRQMSVDFPEQIVRCGEAMVPTDGPTCANKVTADRVDARTRSPAKRAMKLGRVVAFGSAPALKLIPRYSFMSG